LQFLPDEAFDPSKCRFVLGESALAFDCELQSVGEGSQQALVFLLT